MSWKRADSVQWMSKRELSATKGHEILLLVMTFSASSVLSQNTKPSTTIAQLEILEDDRPINKIPAGLTREPMGEVQDCFSMSFAGPQQIPLVAGETVTATLECGGARLTISRSQQPDFAVKPGRPHKAIGSAATRDHDPPISSILTAKVPEIAFGAHKDLERSDKPIYAQSSVTNGHDISSRQSLDGHSTPVADLPSNGEIGTCSENSPVTIVSAIRRHFMRPQQPGYLIIVPNRYVEFVPLGGDPERLYFRRTHCSASEGCSLGGRSNHSLYVIVNQASLCFWTASETQMAPEVTEQLSERQWNVVWKADK